MASSATELLQAPNLSAQTPIQQVLEAPKPEKTLKRKFEDAIHILDSAVRPATSVEASPPPSKRVRASRSLYATLAKYGIKKEAKPSASESRLESLSKTAPHFVAMLSRTASKARNINPFKISTSSPTIHGNSSASEYRPSSTASFLARLATYKLTTYANKPSAIDAVAASKCGWVNDGKDRLLCGICNISWVLASTTGMHRDAANALVEKQRVQLVDMHKDGCPWKSRQCDSSIYRVPLSTPASMVKDLKVRAISLEPLVRDVQIKHPLTAAQMQTIQNIVTSVKLNEGVAISDDDLNPSIEPQSASIFTPLLTVEASATAILTALFGWSIMTPPPPERPRSSASRASSVAPNTPSTSRIAQSSPAVLSPQSTFGPSTPRTPLVSRNTASPSTSASAIGSKIDPTLLYCSLCQRRIGLWAFLPPPTQTEGQAVPRRQLDVLKEHRAYCPYVVRSTTLPSFPVAPPVSVRRSSSQQSLTNMSNPSLAQLNSVGELEGWRAVMSVILRYGSTKKQRLGYSRNMQRGRPSMDSVDSMEDVQEEVDPVAAMVEGVKTHGGRDLLKYVKGLLG